MTVEYVDLETAKNARGTRMVTTSLVPSPWSEAAKGCFRVAQVPVLVVRRGADKKDIDAWTGIDNVPAVFHEREPMRSNWAAIVSLVDRLARSGGGAPILPSGPAERAATYGVLETYAGEDGIGWNARLAMIHAGLTSGGKEGFPEPVSKHLAARYGYSVDAVGPVRERIQQQLAFAAERLTAAGGTYFGGEKPNAVDIYSATFLTPVAAPISEAECPGVMPMLRAAFASAHAAFGSLVPAPLLAHRERMFTTHLQRPITL